MSKKVFYLWVLVVAVQSCMEWISIKKIYLHHETISKLAKKYQHKRLDKKPGTYSKHSRSVGEFEDYYNKLSKCSECIKPDKEIENEYYKSHPGETIAEWVKLMPQKRKRHKLEPENWNQEQELESKSQLGMMSLNYQMVLIQCQSFKNIWSIS